MKLADMKRTKAEKTARDRAWKDGPMMDGDSDYHRGLHIELDHDGMNKVGMTSMPKPGDEYRIEGHGRVIEASDSSREGQKSPNRRVRILVHRLGAEPKSRSDDGKSLKDDVREAASHADETSKDRQVNKGVRA